MLAFIFLELKNCLISRPTDQIREFQRIEAKRTRSRFEHHYVNRNW